MRVLQICNDFAGSKVHCNLFRALDTLGVEQIVYCPVRDEKLLLLNSFEGRYVGFVYSCCIKAWYKFVYHYKLYRLFKDMSSKIDMQQIDYIHAHTLFSDGGLAYLAKKKYGIGYSVAVRNTDYNLFVRFLKHTHLYGRKILLHADKVYFISKGIKDGFVRSSFAQPLLEQMLNKLFVQPNGIDEYWCHNISRTSPNGHSILYIGDFSKNKNVERLIQAVLHLSKEDKYKDIRLILVGGGTKRGDRDATESITQLINENTGIIQYKGKIFDKDQLRKVMSSCALFAMPSIHETFGLVYVEALSQNLPVIYTKGQGIDGMFDNHVGVGVNPYFVNEIEMAITAIFDNYTYYGNEGIDFNGFDWNVIAARYKNDYEMGVSAM